MKKLISLFMVLVMLLSLSACGSDGGSTTKANEERKIKETLTVTISGEPTSLCPHAVGQLNAYIVDFCLYDTLLKKDSSGKILANLATSWDLIDDTHIRFHLRDDVKFSNGDKMTAEDVVFTIKTITEHATTKSTYARFDGENTKAEDDKTVLLVLKQPFAAVYDFLTHPYSSIINKKVYEEVGADKYGQEPLGTGPYVLEKWTSGSNILLKRNDNYWGEKGKSAYINIKIIAEQSNRFMELETGGTDIALSISTNDAKRLAEAKNLELKTVPSYQVVFIALNQTKDETSNLKIRQALAYATDTKQIAQLVYGEYGQVGDSAMAPGIPEYQAQTTYEYNVDKAKELLAEAGYPNGITLTGRVQTNADFEKIAGMIPNMWAKAGITIEIPVYDKATYTEKGKENGGTNISVSSQNATTGNAYQAVGTMFTTTATNGLINNRDEKLEEMIKAAGAEFDDAKRKELYGAVQKYIIENVMIIPIAFTMQISGISVNVQNYEPSASNTPYLPQIFVYE